MWWKEPRVLKHILTSLKKVFNTLHHKCWIKNISNLIHVTILGFKFFLEQLHLFLESQVEMFVQAPLPISKVVKLYCTHWCMQFQQSGWQICIMLKHQQFGNTQLWYVKYLVIVTNYLTFIFRFFAQAGCVQL